MHNVFSVAHLEPYVARPNEPELPMPDLEDDGEWEVEDVRDEAVRHGERYYLVSWKGWPHEYDQWVPEADMANAQQTIAAYRRRARTEPRRMQ